MIRLSVVGAVFFRRCLGLRSVDADCKVTISHRVGLQHYQRLHFAVVSEGKGERPF
jgi:hypothetical protein